MAFDLWLRKSALLALLSAAACSPQSNQSQAKNGTGPGIGRTGQSLAHDAQPSAPARPVARPTGLTAAEEEGIMAGVMAILSAKRFTPNDQMCTNVFDIGRPAVVDSNLSEHDGRVQVVVPVTGQHPVMNPPGWNPQLRFPSRECLGVENESIWAVGRTIPVTFQFYVEHWQSGWRLSQNQQPRNGPF